MRLIACLLFVKLGSIAATTEVVDAATSQFTLPRNERVTLRMLPTRTFGKQVDTEYDESITSEKREVSKLDSDGLTLGITIGTHPQTLRRFGTQNIVMTESQLQNFGAQVQAPSEIPNEKSLADGMQRWGSQGPEVSELPFEPRVMSQGDADQQPITMSEAMVPQSNAEHEKRNQPAIVMSETPIRHSWNDNTIVSEEPLRPFGKGVAATDPKPNPEWHLAWEANIADATEARRVGRFRSGVTQERIALEPGDETEEVHSFERIVDFWRYVFFAACLACLAIHMCRSQQTEARAMANRRKPRLLLRA